MAEPKEWFNEPSFDLGFDDDSQHLSPLIVEDSLDKNEETFEDLSLLIVEDSLDKNGENFQDLSLLIVEDSLEKNSEASHVEDALFAGEVNSHHDDEVKANKTEMSNGVEGGKFEGKLKHDFDLNKVPDEEVETAVNVPTDIEEPMKSAGAKNKRQKVVKSYERAFLDLNKGGLNLNELPDDGQDFGLESDELKKEVYDVLKIYLDSLC